MTSWCRKVIELFLLMWSFIFVPVDANHPEPCWHERVHAARTCQHKGEWHKACKQARQDRDLCLAEHADDDPIGGVTQNCRTTCWFDPMTNSTECITVCEEETYV